MSRALRLAMALLVLGAPNASAERWWVALPRAGLPEELSEFGAAPRPGRRALERTTRRGDPARASRLRLGPSRADLAGLRAEGVEIRFVSRWLSAASCELTPAQTQRLRNRLGERALRPVRRLRRDTQSMLATGAPPAARPKTAGSLDYGPSASQIAMLELDRVHALGYDGQGVRVLVVDTGFQPALAAFAHFDPIASWDFVFGDAVVSDEPADVIGQDRHGTSVLGLLAAYDPGTLIGSASGVELLLAKTEDLAGESTLEEDNFVAALEWGEALGADLCTASLGYRDFDDGSGYAPEDFDGDTAITTRAMDDLAALGVVAVAAAGNGGNLGPATLLTPADADSILTVGAVRPDSILAQFSGRGPTYDGRIKPDVVAQGTAMVVLQPDGVYRFNGGGTSTATPMVAGAAALVLQAHPEWTAMQVVEALRSTADRSTTPDNDYGHGLVRAHAAIFDLAAPIVPLPFELLEPAENASVVADGVSRFRWRRARDLQTPASIEYELQFAATSSFDSVLQSAEADLDSLVELNMLSTQAAYWRVIANDADGYVRESAVRAIRVQDPSASPPARGWAWLRAPRPNPFSTTVLLPYELARPARRRAAIYDLRGRRVRSWPEIPVEIGLQSLRWDGREAGGDQAAAGVYWLRLELRSGDGGVVLQQRLLRLD